MTKYKKTIHNVTTGEITVEPFTDEETANYERDMASVAAKEAVKASAIAKLAALGLSPEEIAAL
jgi:hypothetical protein